MRKTIVTLLLITLFAGLLSSCYDATEVDDMAYVLAVGMEKGISDTLRISVKITTMENGGGDMMQKNQSSEGGEKDEMIKDGYATIVIDAPNLYTGFDMMDSMVPRQLNFVHTKFIVFSEELAKDEGVSSNLTAFTRFRQVRRNMQTIIVRGKASEFIRELTPYIGSTLSKTEELFRDAPNTTGFYPDITWNEFYLRVRSPYMQPMAPLGAVNKSDSFKSEGESYSGKPTTGGEHVAGNIPRKGGGKIELYGAAIFDGEKMVGELNGDETRLALIIRDEYSMGYWNLQDPKEPSLVVGVNLTRGPRNSINIDFQDGKPIIHIKIPLEASVVSIQSKENYEEAEKKHILEKALEQQIKHGVVNLIQKCQALRCDIFKFGLNAAGKFATIDDFANYNWFEMFSVAQVNVDIKVSIKRFDTKMKSSPAISSGGKSE